MSQKFRNSLAMLVDKSRLLLFECRKTFTFSTLGYSLLDRVTKDAFCGSRFFGLPLLPSSLFLCNHPFLCHGFLLILRYIIDFSNTPSNLGSSFFGDIFEIRIYLNYFNSFLYNEIVVYTISLPWLDLKIFPLPF